MQNNTINYIEFKAADLETIKTFYRQCFGWEFTDYGPTYVAFSAKESGIDGGFEKSDEQVINGVLVVLYHSQLENCQATVEKFGGQISVPIFSFPGGRRFHFIDPAGNELAVWSE